MDMDLNSKNLFMSKCDEKKATQKWDWGFVNETMLGSWGSFGKPIKDEEERKVFEINLN